MRYLSLLFLLLFIALSVNAQQWRPVAKVNWDNLTGNQFAFRDSIRYGHKGTMTNGNPQNNDIKFSYAQTYAKLTSNATTTSLYNETRRTYDNNNNLLTASNEGWSGGMVNVWWQKWADTFSYANNKLVRRLHYDRLSSTARPYSLIYEEKYSYDANGNVTIYEKNNWSATQQAMLPYTKIYYLYDANNNVTVDSNLKYDGSQYKIRDVTYNTYNANGKIVEKKNVSYTATGRREGPPTIYYYNAKGLLVADTSWGITINNIFTLSTFATYSYDGNDRLVQEERKHINKNGGVTNTKLYTYSYTSFGYLDQYTYTTISDNGATSKWSEKYYYEIVWPLDVEEIQAPQPREQDLTLYPNPASNVLHIIWRKEDLASVKGRIVDVQGRVLQEWDETCNTIYRKAIDIASMPSGNYFVELQSNLGKVHQQFTILR
ncbi:MAG: T9SS type A sorting domain-containing protein [Flavipsychrobacter sp.]